LLDLARVLELTGLVELARVLELLVRQLLRLVELPRVLDLLRLLPPLGLVRKLPGILFLFVLLL